MRKVVVGLLVMMLLVPLVMVVASCSSDDTTQDKEKALCQALQDFDTAVDDLANISMDSTLDDIQKKEEAISDAWNKVVDAAKDVTSAKIDDLTKAVEDLINYITNIPSGTSIGEALETIGTKLTAVENAWKELTTSLNCDELLQQ